MAQPPSRQRNQARTKNMTLRPAHGQRARWRFVPIVAVLTAVLSILPRPGSAFYCYDCSCVFAEHAQTQMHVTQEHNKTKEHFGTAQPIDAEPFMESGTGELGDYQNWMIFYIFEKIILPAMSQITADIVAAGLNQTAAIGAFMDAGNQLDAQRSIEMKQAEIYSTMKPSQGLCTLGTNTRSLAASEQNGKLTMASLSALALQRDLGVPESGAEHGPDQDRTVRFEQMRTRYCSSADNNAIPGKPKTGLGAICKGDVDPNTMNRDIDYARTLLNNRTLALDFSADATDDQIDLIALMNNLYGHTVFKSVPDLLVNLEDNYDEYMDYRAVLAKRNLARQSFLAIAALKTQGPANDTNTAHLYALMKEIGVEDDEQIRQMLGDRPSYLAQLEVLAKRLYQSPQFYTSLYESPTNVERRGVAMQAINLMVDREIHESRMRSEALTAMLVEMGIIPRQHAIQTNINNSRSRGAR